MLISSLLGLLFVLSVVLLAVHLRHRFVRRKRYRVRRAKTVAPSAPSIGFSQKKPEWATFAVLALHEQLCVSHRKLAVAFNRLYFASTGISVGRTWVRKLLMRCEYDALHAQRNLKHRIPLPLPVNCMWGIDTTVVCDAGGQSHIVLGIIDHGSRLNIALRKLKRFNSWTLIGSLFIAFGRFGRPEAIKSDNHPVFRSKWVKRVMRWCGVRMRFSQPAKPWQNGRIERMFGTFKSHLRGYAIRNGWHLLRALESFRYWHNEIRSHQHLGGHTPLEAWHGVNPYAQAPLAVSLFSAWDGRLRGLALRR